MPGSMQSRWPHDASHPVPARVRAEHRDAENRVYALDELWDFEIDRPQALKGLRDLAGQIERKQG